MGEVKGTSYLDVYTQAITEFKDPNLKAIYSDDIILFCGVMENFFNNAVNLFTSPIKVRERLSKRVSPNEQSESFVGDGIATAFKLTNPPLDEDIEYTIFTYNVNGEKINAKYDEVQQSVITELPVLLDSVLTVDIYFVGKFELELYSEEIHILAMWIMFSWSQYVYNDKMDVNRLLGDTDFKLVSNSTTTTAKTGWMIVNRENVTKLMNKYAWDSISMRRYL